MQHYKRDKGQWRHFWRRLAAAASAMLGGYFFKKKSPSYRDGMGLGRENCDSSFPVLIQNSLLDQNQNRKAIRGDYSPRIAAAAALGLSMALQSLAAGPSLLIAEVPVPNHSAHALQAGIAAAFAQVLIKYSGNSAVMSIPGIRDSLSHIDSFVRSYSYHSTVDENKQAQLWLHVDFSSSQLRQLLMKTGQSIWSIADRPPVLVLLREPASGAGAYALLTMDDAAKTSAKALMQIGQQRGIPLLLPLMDLSDQAAMGVLSKWPPSAETLQNFSNRYAVKTVLIGDETVQATGVTVQWDFSFNDTVYHWTLQGSTIQEVASRTVKHVASTMASQFAFIADPHLQTRIGLQLEGISDIQEYARVLKFLRTLAPVVKVEPSDIQGESALLWVTILGGAEAFEQAIPVKQHLEPLPGPPVFSEAMNDSEPLVYYRWRN